VSVENAKFAALRIPWLIRTPAALRWISAEPLLGPLDLSPWISALDWVVIGGESGAEARPVELAWFEAILRLCDQRDTAVYTKQLGSRWREQTGAKHPKGGDPREWPPTLWVRTLPDQHWTQVLAQEAEAHAHASPRQPARTALTNG